MQVYKHTHADMQKKPLKEIFLFFNFLFAVLVIEHRGLVCARQPFCHYCITSSCFLFLDSAKRNDVFLPSNLIAKKKKVYDISTNLVENSKLKRLDIEIYN